MRGHSLEAEERSRLVAGWELEIERVDYLLDERRLHIKKQHLRTKELVVEQSTVMLKIKELDASLGTLNEKRAELVVKRDEAARDE